MQDDIFTRSHISTIIIVVITSNLHLLKAPGNTFLPSVATSLPKDSVANISQIFTIDQNFLTERISTLLESIQEEVDEGLRMVLRL